jgi:AcrR family transcriptional regulator
MTNRARKRVTRDRILDAAVEIADREGLAAVTMRRLGQRLGVEAMSLYKHVADKDEVLAGLAERVAAEFTVPRRDVPWRTALRESGIAAQSVLLRHPWAGPLLESRTDLGPARLAYVDAVIGVLREAGFSFEEVGHAFTALDSHLYGFTMQVANWPFNPDEPTVAAEELVAGVDPERYPNLVAMAMAAASADPPMQLDFTYGLDLLLDGMARRLPRRTVRPRTRPRSGSRSR